MIKITKQLTRPDGGNVSANSILDYNAKFVGNKKAVIFKLSLYFSQAALDSGKPPVRAVTNFFMKETKICTEAEWAKLNEAGSHDLVQVWLKDLIDLKIGLGFTEIV